MNQYEQDALKNLTETHEFLVLWLANLRIERFKKWWRKTFSSKHEVSFSFGMGIILLEVNGEQIDYNLDRGETPKYKWHGVPFFQELVDVIRDLDEITSDQRTACPEDFKVKGARKPFRPCPTCQGTWNTCPTCGIDDGTGRKVATGRILKKKRTKR